MVSEKEFNEKYIQRIKEARERVGYSQADMARLLDIKKDRYQKYEQRSPMPLYLLDKFALICRIDPLELITGHPPERRIPKRKFPE